MADINDQNYILSCHNCEIYSLNKIHSLSFLYVDEVGALVFDIGSYSVRAGYAGEDCPKVSRSLMT